jgi:cysteinyl-tRNA synthetase
MKIYSFKILFGIGILAVLAACPIMQRPDISVSTSGTAIPSGESYDFRVVSLGESKTVTFVIKNGGSANLELTGSPEKVQVTGTDASLFSVDSQPASPIVPGASQTFTVTFSPLTTGTKTASLTIPSNDLDESTYRIKLTGCGDRCSYYDKAKNLTSDSTADDQNPAFSPDGETLLFSSIKNVLGAKYIIKKMDLLTGKVTLLTDETDGDNINMPGSSWNKTTNMICFFSNRYGNFEILMMDDTGGSLDRITNRPATDTEATFSPDGQWVVFQSDYYRSRDIHKIKIDDVLSANLTNLLGDDIKPNWSPQGNKIVFQSNRDGNWEIYTMNADGTDVRNITNDPADDTDPSWSPDGTKIVYASTRGGLAEPEIFVINAAGIDEPERITDYAGYDGAPSFSPDGCSIAFESDRDGNLDIWRISYASQPIDWSSVNDFAYQLYNISLIALGTSKFDLLIIDYSADGSDAQRFTPEEIAALKNSPGGKKLVLAYMSIGEAQNFRGYWNPDWVTGNPSWLGLQNPEQPGNYAVQYWNPAWKAIIFGSPDSYLDQIIAAGFDGVYLDHVNAYEYWGPGGASGLNRSTAEQDMVNLVKTIANYARTIKCNPYFGIFPQNAEALSSHNDYVQTVTGIGAEDVWYNDNISQSSSYTNGVLQNLDVFDSAGKLVLVVDYVTQIAKIDDFYQKAVAKDYVPYATQRTLDVLTINAGHEPD